ncbi:MAG: DEAD/DEAH box helicase, partial [Methylobacter sp.]|nr:DEAD/DEAH box helicase [Methylobacter sp.]
MNIIHGIWLPKDTQDFIQPGNFYLWIEIDEAPAKIKSPLHPQQLPETPCLEFLKTELLVNPIRAGQGKLLSLLLPTVDGKPLPSPELQSVDATGAMTLQDWQVYGFPLDTPLKTINNIHFLCCYQSSHSRVGSDFLFWYYFSQSLKHLLAKDQYLPLLISKKTGKSTEFYRRWQAVSSNYEQLIHSAVTQMPLACSQHYRPESLLRHFAEVVIDELLSAAAADMPQVFTKRVQDEFLADMLLFTHSAEPLQTSLKPPEEFKQWFQWQQKLLGSEQHSSLQLGLQLLEASAEQVDAWRLVFFLSSHQDASLKLDLDDFWDDNAHFHQALQQQFGNNIEQQLLIQLAQAARIYPKLWLGMECSEPESVQLNLDEAFDFLKESAWILEDAGFKVIVPAWLTPKGRRRAKIRMRSSSKKPSKAETSKSYFSMEKLTHYQYELAIGDIALTPEEWQQLVDSKAPLIHFRGQWMELDRDKMQEMLSFMQQQNNDVPEMTVQQLLKKLAEDEDDFELDINDSLAQMLAKLADTSQLEAIDNPKQLNAKLREYQKRGVSWLRYLENLGLNGCLADDMGLGKTMQVITLLVLEREHNQPAPTLLIVPTSVIGNWQKEIDKFAPHLTTLIHHGSGREQDAKAFKAACKEHDVLITSYTLARKDAKLLGALHWRRIVLDEAQNIKNPVAAQTKAILKLNADSRLALTGTPVENRLMDLWSIFNFLNPGYLGKQAQFRKIYELPVQRDNDPIQSTILKKLIQPFILRRLKTDKNIIKDLPDKI